MLCGRSVEVVVRSAVRVGGRYAWLLSVREGVGCHGELWAGYTAHIAVYPAQNSVCLTK